MSGCDESKCVSKGRAYAHDDSFTCYGDEGLAFPMMCADGFLPKIVEDEPPLVHSEWWGEVPVSYFTCCPPDSDSVEEVTRQCSDPITGILDFDDEHIDSVCDNDKDDLNPTRTVPRQMKTSLVMQVAGGRSFDFAPTITDSFLCCEHNEDDGLESSSGSSLPEQQLQFLDDAECVPYRNHFYENKAATNIYGVVRVISCDFPDGDFANPRPVGNGTYDDVVTTGRYQCCRKGPPLDPFVHDQRFAVSVYPTYILWWIAAVLSAIVFVALLVPLWVQIRDGTLQDPRSSSLRSSSLRRRRSSSQSRRNAPVYSTYNLYLVYLSFADLVYCGFQIWFYSGYMSQKFNPNFYSIMADVTDMVIPVTVVRALDGPITLSYVFTNMFLNTIISYQLLSLLRKSQQSQRMKQPKLRTIHLHCGLLYAMAILYATFLFLMRDACGKALDNYNIERVVAIANVLKPLWNALIIIPVVLIVIVGFWIWWGDYIPRNSTASTSARDRALRQLVFFFSRIVAVFLLVWIPVQTLTIVGVVKLRSHYFLVVWWLMASQIILSFVMLLTKYDVRKYILDLVTLSYIFGKDQPSSVFDKKLNPSKATASSCIDEVDDNDEAENDALVYSVLGFAPLNENDLDTDNKPEIDTETGIAFASDGVDKVYGSDGADDKAGVDANADTDDGTANAGDANGDSGISELLENIRIGGPEHEIVFQVAENGLEQDLVEAVPELTENV